MYRDLIGMRQSRSVKAARLSARVSAEAQECTE
jgi:hypothetical protein